MKKIFKNIIAPQLLAVILLMSISNLTYSQNKPQFIKNKGQFHTNINFKLEHQAGNIYFEKNRIKYDLYEKDKINAEAININVTALRFPIKVFMLSPNYDYLLQLQETTVLSVWLQLQYVWQILAQVHGILH